MISAIPLSESVTAWLIGPGIRLAIIAVAALLALRFGRYFIGSVIRGAVRSKHYGTKSAEKKREDTLIRVFSLTFSVSVLTVAAIMALSEVGINTTALVASAGIVGVAVGFGGQWLIKDLINGFFIILENQYRVGDVICAADKCGLVEDINLRVTILRDLDGTAHHIPNGEIKIASNLSKEYSNVNLSVGVSYDADLKQVIRVINAVGKELAADPEWKDHIRKPPQFTMVSDFGDSAIQLSILGQTEPLKQWGVAGEFRLRLKLRFDKEGIEIPYPQQVVYLAGGVEKISG